MLGQFFKQTSNYTLGSILMVFAGLVSFPVLTRVLSVSDYGLMSLVGMILTLLVALGKMGMQHATLRFYSEIQAGKRDVSPQIFVSTAVLGTAAAGLVVAALWAAISPWVPENWWSDVRVKPLLLLTSGLIFIRVFDSALVNQLRAQERSGALMVYSVVRRYAALGLLLAVLYFWAGDIWGFFGATIAGELLGLLCLFVWMFRKNRLQVRLFSPPLFRVMVVFGLPMIGFELSGVVLSMGDRSIIQNLLGVEQLGLYSAAYNLCDYIKGVLFASMIAAAQPMYIRLWEKNGVAETTEFLRRFVGLYMMASMLVVAGVAAVGGELIGMLASTKYRGAENVMPWIIAGMAVESLIVITAAGLYIQKRSKTIMVLVFLSAALNLSLNFVLIPYWGLVGSGVATLVSCLLLMGVGAYMGRHTLPMFIPAASSLKFAGIAATMYLIVTQIHFAQGLLTMAVRMALGLAIYAGLALALDKQCRADFAVLRTKLHQKINKQRIKT
jgi:O-antigen/teichoic acid export membrane protein